MDRVTKEYNTLLSILASIMYHQAKILSRTDIRHPLNGYALVESSSFLRTDKVFSYGIEGIYSKGNASDIFWNVITDIEEPSDYLSLEVRYEMSIDDYIIFTLKYEKGRKTHFLFKSRLDVISDRPDYMRLALDAQCHTIASMLVAHNFV